MAFCYAGHDLLLSGYNRVIDEQLADFDAFIYSRGRLAWPLPPEWQGDAAALNLNFMLPVENPVAWVSSYLPMNAALRAVLGTLTGPLLTALCVQVLWSCARKIWPEQREAAAISVLLLACSGQVLLMGMTSFAMAAHLFFNLVWLRLFLVSRPGADIAALVAGFVATGLHQPLFHPMFVAPFLLLLLVERNWRRLILFVIGYGLIGLFWLAWPHYIGTLVAGPHSITASAGTDFWSRMLAALSHNKDNLRVMAANLLRFLTWNHLLLLPLVFASWRAVRRDRFAAALALGLVLPIVVVAIILPSQGFGFGYRYLHGVIGNAALLGGYGWLQLADRHEQLRPFLLRVTAAGILVVLPFQSWLAYRTYAPFADLNAQIDASGTDYVVIGKSDAIGAMAFAANRPDLSNRPIRLIADKIDYSGPFTRRICRNGATVGLPTAKFYQPIATKYRMGLSPTADIRGRALADVFELSGCKVKMIGPK